MTLITVTQLRSGSFPEGPGNTSGSDTDKTNLSRERKLSYITRRRLTTVTRFPWFSEPVPTLHHLYYSRLLSFLLDPDLHPSGTGPSDPRPDSVGPTPVQSVLQDVQDTRRSPNNDGQSLPGDVPTDVV